MRIFRITYTMTAPVSHIGQVASVGAYFNTVRTASGEIPVITGNSVRGILRDKAADRLLNAYGQRVSKEVFNVLYSGGNISGAAKNDVARARAVREAFPAVSLFGAGLGTMMMAGMLQCGFLYPVCMETEDITGIKSFVSWHDLMDDIEFTRMDDTKDDTRLHHIEDIEASSNAKASTQMRFNVQYMAPGTQFVQDIVLLDGITDMEEGCLYAAISDWFANPVLGGMSSKGFGRFNAESEDCMVRDGVVTMSGRAQELTREYTESLIPLTIAANIYLLAAGKEAKGGKKANGAD